MVMSAIVVLTMIAVELAYKTQLEYHLALRQKERLQAYYLAHSAYQLTLMELKSGEAMKNQISQALAQANIESPIDLSAPLCETMPMNTFILRMVGAGGEMEEKKEEEKKEGASPLQGVAFQGVEEFLQFQGDFTASCKDESSRINLNFFYGLDPSKETIGGDNPYDDLKKLIAKILSDPSHSELFEEAGVTPQDLARNIADWVDMNESINELGGGERGAEDLAYRGDQTGMTAKNGKFSTPQDIFKVAGITDRLWIPFQELFTIYGVAEGATGPLGKPQINVCNAPDAIVRGMILRYTEIRSELPPIKEDDEAILIQLVEAVRLGCMGGKPDKNEIAKALDDALLLLLKVSSPPPPATPTGGAGTGETGTGGVSLSPFADWIAEGSRFYSLKLQGVVKKTTLNIDAVIDLGELGGQDAQKWKLVYWRIY